MAFFRCLWSRINFAGKEEEGGEGGEREGRKGGKKEEGSGRDPQGLTKLLATPYSRISGACTICHECSSTFE